MKVGKKGYKAEKKTREELTSVRMIGIQEGSQGNRKID